MNHPTSNKLNLTTAKEEHAFNEELLVKHPGNAVLKRALDKWKLIGKRCKDAMTESKKEGYSAEFEKFWQAFPKVKGSSKVKAWGNWCLALRSGVEAEFLIGAAKAYAKDMKASDAPSVAHASTWLSPTEKRWESYEKSGKVKLTKTCPKCFNEVEKLHYHSYRDEKGCCFSEHICSECEKL